MKTEEQQLADLYAQIETQQKQLASLVNAPNPVPPTSISEVSLKLAILNGVLGMFVTKLKAQQLEAERDAYRAAKESGASDTGAASTARLDTTVYRALYETADTRHTDIWKLISMAQSHIRALSDEQKGTA